MWGKRRDKVKNTLTSVEHGAVFHLVVVVGGGGGGAYQKFMVCKAAQVWRFQNISGWVLFPISLQMVMNLPPPFLYVLKCLIVA